MFDPVVFDDTTLIPIRNPGDDAEDEMVTIMKRKDPVMPWYPVMLK